MAFARFFFYQKTNTSHIISLSLDITFGKSLTMNHTFSKTIRISALFISLLSILFIYSCSKDNNNNSSTPPAVAPVLPGNWMVHYYFDVTDKTSNYAAYTFTFNSNGTFTATKTGAVNNGTWTDLIDSGKRKFILDFDASVTDSNLLELEEDWIVTSSTSTLIELLNKSVVLHFMKK